MCDLFLFTLRKSVIVAAQFKDVLWQLAWNLRRGALLVLVSPIEPEMDLLKHLVHAKAVLKDENLLQGRHLEGWDTAATLTYRCSCPIFCLLRWQAA